MKVKLITPGLEFIKELDLPAFYDTPAVIHWGARTFQWQRTDNDKDTLYYVECLTWTIPV